jgi:glutamyl-Q tRNA(Asp) synthetase
MSPEPTEPPNGNEPARPVLRFAPSPTGRLHLGHALSVLINVDLARRLGGRFLVRIEDTDVARCRPEFTAAILDDLDWLGVRSDVPVLRQSEHLATYAAAAARLAAMGLLYPCFATRQEVQASARPGATDPDGAPLYPGLWRGRDPAEVARMTAAGAAHAMRLDVARALGRLETMGELPLSFTELDEALVPRTIEARPDRWGDVVIVRKEGPAAYHLAVVVDDARQSVTHVVRGADLRAATDVHRLLQVLLGLPAPVYHHHRLITAADGRKLSKRDGDTSLATLRALGATPADIRRMAGLKAARQG